MAEKKHDDQEFVEYVVKSLVNNPADVKTERTVDERGVLISLHLNQADMGYVIGRSGQTARALRTLLRIVGAKNDARVNLKIVEPEGSTRGPRATETVEEEVDTDAVEELKI
ncbi:MAG: KH domain-containing protein [Parcubacteria group bacterium]|nr:KH domain-containing protein [Parcubacteria group bacterium]